MYGIRRRIKTFEIGDWSINAEEVHFKNAQELQDDAIIRLPKLKNAQYYQ